MSYELPIAAELLVKFYMWTTIYYLLHEVRVSFNIRETSY